MKLISIVCLLNFNILFGQRIVWKEDIKLNWTHFKSNINNQRGKNVAAYTNCGWVYSVVRSTNPKSPVKIKIETIFNKDKSWKDSKRINNYILRHEQGHFDIAEMYARKLRKEIAVKISTSGDFSKYFQAIYNTILNEYKDFQAFYDRDTKNGMNEVKQSEYNRIITKELENLKSYKAY